MKKFILFFRGGTGGEDWSPWINKTKEKGNFIEGAPLVKNGLIVKSNGSKVEDFVFNIEENARAYMIMQAKDIDEVISLSKECPVYENEGNITIRPIEENL